MEKKTIVLAYSTEMSASLLVTKMRKAVETKRIEAGIFAISASDTDSQLESKNVDILFLGLQVRFIQSQLVERLAPKGASLDVINMTNYGMMNDEKVLDQAKKPINK